MRDDDILTILTRHLYIFSSIGWNRRVYILFEFGSRRVKDSLQCFIATTAAALTFEEIRTPYASGREIWVQRFGNAYQRNREMNDAFQKHLYDSAKKRSSRRCALSRRNIRVSSVIVCIVCSSRRFETESRFLRTLYTSLPWFCVELSFYA